jgi:hypothetical protein
MIGVIWLDFNQRRIGRISQTMMERSQPADIASGQTSAGITANWGVNGDLQWKLSGI